MKPRRFSKSVAAAVLAVSMLAVGATAPADAATVKQQAKQSRLDTGWG